MRVLVWGTGSIGERHLRILSGLPGVEPVALPVRRARNRDLRSKGFEVVRHLGEAGKPDAVIIATQTARHPRDLDTCIRAGVRHVLVEKPLAARAADLRQVHGRALKGNVFVGFCLRFDAGLRRFRRLLPRIGDVYHVEAEARSYLPEWRPGRDYRTLYSSNARQGGVLRDLLHDVDYCLWLYGRPRRVAGWVGRSGVLDMASDDHATLAWRVNGGPAVTVKLDYLSREPRRRMTAYGTRGALAWDALRRIVTLKVGNAKPSSERIAGTRDSMYVDQMNAFVDSVRGRPSGSLATYEEGRFAVAAADAARRSSSTHRIERVNA